jgi:hypothetical protein
VVCILVAYQEVPISNLEPHTVLPDWELMFDCLTTPHSMWTKSLGNGKDFLLKISVGNFVLSFHFSVMAV